MTRLAASVLAIASTLVTATTMPGTVTGEPKLVWADEFDGPDGALPDPARWHIEVNGAGGGNNELQYYTARRKNVHLSGGHLVITADREHYRGADGVAREYTSARLNTEGTFAHRYGRFEARIQVPRGQGVWPAFWMLGDSFKRDGWPRCAEIDVLENVGREPATIHGTIHAPGYCGARGISSKATLPGAAFADDFHVFSVDWRPGLIEFKVDDRVYGTRVPTDLSYGTRWAFDDRTFFMILNLAIGGHWPGPPDASTQFPLCMRVDYVRVYDSDVRARESHDE